MTAGGRFLTRGLTKVKAEVALSILAYNILRAINLIGAPNLRARLARIARSLSFQPTRAAFLPTLLHVVPWLNRVRGRVSHVQ